MSAIEDYFVETLEICQNCAHWNKYVAFDNNIKSKLMLCNKDSDFSDSYTLWDFTCKDFKLNE